VGAGEGDLGVGFEGLGCSMSIQQDISERYNGYISTHFGARGGLIGICWPGLWLFGRRLLGLRSLALKGPKESVKLIRRAIKICKQRGHTHQPPLSAWIGIIGGTSVTSVRTSCNDQDAPLFLVSWTSIRDHQSSS
jgi:hypothetical protein